LKTTGFFAVYLQDTADPVHKLLAISVQEEKELHMDTHTHTILFVLSTVPSHFQGI
jgi:hypothetical protein